MSSRPILVGVFGAPHGVRGELRLKSYTEQPLAIAGYSPLAAEGGRQSFTLEAVRILKGDMLVVRVKDVRDRLAAESLTNVKLFIDRALLPAAEADEFYHADLVGLQAETGSGLTLGRVVALQNFGAGDLLEIALGAGETILVPFSQAYVPVVDLDGGRLVVADAALASDGEAPEPQG